MRKDGLRRTLAIVAASSALGPFANVIYAPSLVALRDFYQTTNTLAGASVAVFGLVLALAQMAAGPITDRFSAKRVLVGGLLLYCAGDMLAYLAGAIETFILARALQAAGAAAGLVVGGAIVTDRFPAAERARPMATLQMANAVGGTLGPLLGSGIAEVFGWRTNSLALLVAGLALAAAAARYLPDFAAPAQRFTASTMLAVVRYRVTAGVLLATACQFFAHYTFISYMPVVLRERVGVPQALLGFLFLPLTLSVFVGSHLGGGLGARYGPRTLVFGGSWATAAATLVFGLVVLLPPEFWTVPALATCLAVYGLSVGVAVPGQMMMMVERFARDRGAAMGTYASLRYLGAAAGPVATGLVLERFGLASAFLSAGLLMAAATVAAHGLIGRQGGRG